MTTGSAEAQSRRKTKGREKRERERERERGRGGREGEGEGEREREREREREIERFYTKRLSKQTTSGCTRVKFSLRRRRLLDPRKYSRDERSMITDS